MSYSIGFTRSFDRSAKKLKKKFPQFANDIKRAIRLLSKRPNTGDVIPRSKGLRKLRVANSDQKRGKRAGYRLIYKVIQHPKPIIIVLFVYFKPDKADLTAAEIEELRIELEEALER